MCPTCHQLLELSNAPVADRIRAFIETRIEAGDTTSEIKDKLVSEFGEAGRGRQPRARSNPRAPPRRGARPLRPLICAARTQHLATPIDLL